MNQTPGKPGVPGADRVKHVARDPRGAEDPEDTSLKRPAGETDLRAPHERDEAPDPLDSTDATPIGGPRQKIEQAASDVSRGLIDTERRGVPNDVPAPGPAPEQTPGAEVPDEGIDRQSLARRREMKDASGGF